MDDCDPPWVMAACWVFSGRTQTQHVPKLGYFTHMLTCSTFFGGGLGAGFPIEGGGQGGHSTMEVIPPPFEVSPPTTGAISSKLYCGFYWGKFLKFNKSDMF